MHNQPRENRAAAIIANQDIRPIPDPTILTTQQLYHELNSLRELVETRLDAMDKATELLNANMTRIPTETDKQVGHLKELHDEKFESIDKQFLERDNRVDKIAELNQKAIDAALQAAKEAVGEQNKSSATAIGKSEASMTKQLDQITNLITTTNKTLDEKINSIKTFYDSKIDDVKKEIAGLRESRSESGGKSKGGEAIWGYVVGVIGLIAVVIGVVINLAK